MNPERGRLRLRPVARALLLILLVIVISGFQVHGEGAFLASPVFVHRCVLSSWRESASSVELCLSDTCPFIENRGPPGLGSALCFTPRRQDAKPYGSAPAPGALP